MNKLYDGMDLHAGKSLIVLLDEQEQAVCEKRIPNDLEKILLQLRPYHSAVQALVVESTYNFQRFLVLTAAVRE